MQTAMNRCTCIAALLLPALLLPTRTALGLGGDYPRGQQVVSRPDDWPKGLKDALELQPHEGGYFVNANDFYWFSGDAPALNGFLTVAAKIDGAPVSVHFHSGKGEGKPPWPDKGAVPIDWQVSIFRRGWSRELPEDAPTKYVVVIDVWEGGQVDRKAVAVPAGIATQPSTAPAAATTRPASRPTDGPQATWDGVLRAMQADDRQALRLLTTERGYRSLVMEPRRTTDGAQQELSSEWLKQLGQGWANWGRLRMQSEAEGRAEAVMGPEVKEHGLSFVKTKDGWKLDEWRAGQ